MKKPYSGDPAQTCPFRLGEKCEDACPTCEMFQCFRGCNPNTGAEIDRWQCALSILPFLMIENSQQQRQTGAAVESFRNRMADDFAQHTKNTVQALGIAMQIAGHRPPQTLIADQS